MCVRFRALRGGPGGVCGDGRAGCYLSGACLSKSPGIRLTGKSGLRRPRGPRGVCGEASRCPPVPFPPARSTSAGCVRRGRVSGAARLAPQTGPDGHQGIVWPSLWQTQVTERSRHNPRSLEFSGHFPRSDGNMCCFIYGQR